MAPEGAVESEVSGVQVWTMSEMNEIESRELRGIIEILPRRGESTA
jgi:hypothetical protein